MKLENAIKQSTFTSEDQKVLLNLIYTFYYIKQKQKEFFDPYGITAQQYNVLRILRGVHPKAYTVYQIRERMLDKMSDASRIVDRLVKKGLVNRSITPADKRKVDVTINKKGLSLLKNIDKPLEKFMQKTFKDLSPAEKETLDRLLDKVRGA